jgi:hypothetical protein
MGKFWRSPIAQHRIRLNRGDIGFGQEAVMAWHEQGEGRRPSYLFKLKLTSNVKKAITAVPWDDWQGKSNEGLVQVVEIRLKLNGWSCERRVIVERTLKPLNASPQGSFWRQCEEDFSAYVTNLKPEEADAFQIVQLYRQRADAEWSGATWTGAKRRARRVRPEGSVKTSLTNSRTNGDFPGSVHKKRR